MALMPVTDAVYLLSETRQTPTHVGSLQVYEMPDGAGPDWLREQYTWLLSHDEPHTLFARRPARSLRTLGQWAWEHDDQFDIEYHVRHSALPEPGRVRGLLEIGSRLHGSLLDRSRPLWEYHLIEGLEGNRFAAYNKVHHAVIDGVSGLRLLDRTLASEPDGETRPPWAPRASAMLPTVPAAAPTVAEPVPTAAGGPAAGNGAAEGRTDDDDGSHGILPLGLLNGAARAARDALGVTPALLDQARRAIGDDLAAFPFKAPASMLNTRITGARRVAADTWSLQRVRTLGRSVGATVNDVVLAMCAGALRRYLSDLDALPDQPLTAMVPVSTRSDSGAGGNAVGAILCSLATTTTDPGERLTRIQESIELGKATIRDRSSLQVTLLSAANMAPMSLMALLGGGGRLRPAFNLIISNVPGPRKTLYFNGARLQGIYPMSVPYHGQALNITIASYVDNLEFGLTGCRRNVPHLQRLLGHLEESLVELEQAAGERPLARRRRSAAAPAGP
jgi:WS/DGAT/MGAT family acyltransferase